MVRRGWDKFLGLRPFEHCLDAADAAVDRIATQAGVEQLLAERLEGAGAEFAGRCGAVETLQRTDRISDVGERAGGFPLVSLGRKLARRRCSIGGSAR